MFEATVGKVQDNDPSIEEVLLEEALQFIEEMKVTEYSEIDINDVTIPNLTPQRIVSILYTIRNRLYGDMVKQQRIIDKGVIK